MDPLLVAYGGALFFSSCLSLGLAVMAFFRREVPGARAFLYGNFSAFFYAFGSILEIQAQSPDQLLAALTTEYLGIATIGPFLLLLAISATRGSGAVSRPWTGALFVLPVMIIAAVATNSLHHLFYTSISLEHRGPFSVPVLGKGPVYMVNLAYMNLCLFWGVLTAAREVGKATGAQKPPLILLLVAALVPWSGMALYQSGLSPWGLDTAPFGLAVSGVVFAVALFRFRLFDLTPLVVDQVFANMREGVMVVDLKGRLVGVNPAMAAIVPGVDRSQVGRNLTELAIGAPVLAPLAAGPPGASFDLRGGSEDRPRTFQVDGSPLRDRKGRNMGTIYLLSDITQRQELEARLARMARADELTGLPNRRAFLERLRDEVGRFERYGKVFSLALADVDHFKAVNDTLGHDAGDAALVHLARVWDGCLRSSDQSARYGGEEFTILMPGTDGSEALTLLERLRTQLESQPLIWNGSQIWMTASFGLATAGPGVDPDDLVRRADRALYRAKAQGRNQVRVDGEDL